ncbi:CoA-binding protein [Alkalicoccus halolimnae]|uniref:CoA-binding protein n=1 Tax=Alkalicoccus halolimnae TaxID=1667239 RepID=A0A5C7FLL9_9BACI|nr:CoA-binding protein [Alkalicoccus halolimnae]TXF87254.1 CoA-binding protein [Alkalicoccus halolimnae]
MNTEERRKVLENAKHIAVVGLSDKPHRTSYQITEFLLKAGYEITPVNPTVSEVLGKKSVDSIGDLPASVDIINVFRRSEYLPALAEEAVKTDIPVFWAQLGVYDEEAEKLLKKHGKQVEMDSCIKVEHTMLLKN